MSECSDRGQSMSGYDAVSILTTWMTEKVTEVLGTKGAEDLRRRMERRESIDMVTLAKVSMSLTPFLESHNDIKNLLDRVLSDYKDKKADLTDDAYRAMVAVSIWSVPEMRDIVSTSYQEPQRGSIRT